MKLRIKGNSLRLRVSRSEFDRLKAGSRLEETIRFAPGPNATLTYLLEVDSAASGTGLHYGDRRIAVVIDENQLGTWSQPDQVGIYSKLDISSEEQLELILEKDFNCLHRSDEDQSDRFPNLNARVAH